MNEIRGIKVHTLESLRYKKDVVQLTKWLGGFKEAVEWLCDEYERISADPDRTCYLVSQDCKFALFVNDMTGGAWKLLEEE